MERRRIGKLGIWGIQEIGNFGSLGGSENREIRESGSYGKLGKIIICGKKKTLENPERFGIFGDWVIREIGGYGRNGSLRSFGKFERSGKLIIRVRRRKRWRGEHVDSGRVEKLGKWKIREIRSFGKLGNSGDSEDGYTRGSSEIPE